MGLSIGYTLTFAGSDEEARLVMQALHSTALDLPLEHVTELRQLSGDACSPEHHPPMDPVRDLLAGPGERIYYVTGERWPDELLFQYQTHIVQPEHVIGFSTSPGSGCEEADFALCRYPALAPTPHGTLRTALPGWRWHAFCKTQYASNPKFGGRANFLRCHLSVIALLDKAKELGCRVEVDDDGDFWDARDLGQLLREVAAYNGLVAAWTGRLKDEVDLTSPILEYPDYEHWEALGEGLAPLQPLLERVRTRRPEENPDTSRGEARVSKPPSGSDKAVRRGQPPPEKATLDLAQQPHQETPGAPPPASAPQPPHAPAVTATQSSPSKCPTFKNKAEGAASLIAAMEGPHSLHDAVDLIGGLLERGADPLAPPEPDEQSPLEIAVKVHPCEFAEAMLDHLHDRGFDLWKSARVSALLTSAAMDCNDLMVELLLRYNANPNLPHQGYYSPLVQVMLRRQELLESAEPNPEIDHEEQEDSDDEEWQPDKDPEFAAHLEAMMIEAGGDRQRALDTVLAAEACWIDRERARMRLAQGADPAAALRRLVRCHPACASREAAEILFELGADARCVTAADVRPLFRQGDGAALPSRILELARLLIEQGNAAAFPPELRKVIIEALRGEGPLFWEQNDPFVRRWIAPRFRAGRRFG